MNLCPRVRSLKIGHGSDVPSDFRGHMIRFTALDAFEPRPLYEVFDPKLWHANYADGAFFKDKIVMVGPSAQVVARSCRYPDQSHHTWSGTSLAGDGRGDSP